MPDFTLCNILCERLEGIKQAGRIQQDLDHAVESGDLGEAGRGGSIHSCRFLWLDPQTVQHDASEVTLWGDVSSITALCHP